MGLRVLDDDRHCLRRGDVPAWARRVLQFAASRIPPSKIIQGVPLYGYDWTAQAPAVGGTYQELVGLARRHGVQLSRDATNQHLFFEYTAGDVRHEVWLVDATTLGALLDIGRDVGVAGYSLWRLGGEDPAVWGPIGAASRR